MTGHHGQPGDDWLRRAMHAMDASIVLATLFLVTWLLPAVQGLDAFVAPSLLDQPLATQHLFLILIASLLFPAVGEVAGLYQPWRGRSLYTMLGVFSVTWAIVVALVSLLLTALQEPRAFSGDWMLYAALATLISGSVLRTTLYISLRRVRAAGHNQKRVVLIGRSRQLDALETQIMANPQVGYLTARRLEDSQRKSFLVEVRRFAKDTTFQRDFDEVWLGYPLTEGERVRQLAALLAGVPVTLRYFPEQSEARLLNHRITELAGRYALELNYTPLTGPRRLAKMLEDRLLGALLFIAFLPVMLVIALVIRLRMGGPVLFKQERHGLDGKRFKIYKFRSMAPHSSTRTHQASHGDPRVTPLGAFLRRTSLDELPQLYNVLQGRMSLVGPRPHAMDHNDHYKDHIESYMQRHRVKPGMTGWAQVNGWRGNTHTLEAMQQRVEHDLFYIDNWSLGFDFKILVMTLSRGFINGQP